MTQITKVDFKNRRRLETIIQSGTSALPLPLEDDTRTSSISNEVNKNALLLELVKELFSALNDIVEDEEQSPLNPNSVFQAYSFFSNFEIEKYKRPDILIERDGTITLEFQSTMGIYSLLINFSGFDVIHYAGYFDEQGECHGKEFFDGTYIPDSLYFNLERVYNKQ